MEIKIIPYFILFLFSLPAFGEQEEVKYYHYKNQFDPECPNEFECPSNLWIRSSAGNCSPKFGESFKTFEDDDVYAYRPFDPETEKLFNEESFITSHSESELVLLGLEGNCKSYIVIMPKELAIEGILEVNEVKKNDQVYYIGEKSIVKAETPKGDTKCMIPPGSFLRINSFSYDLDFTKATIENDTGSSYRLWGTEWDEEVPFCQRLDTVFISPQLLDHGEPDASVLLDFKAIQEEKWAKQACSTLKAYITINNDCYDIDKKFQAYNDDVKENMRSICLKAYQHFNPKDNPIIKHLHHEITSCLGNRDCNNIKLNSVKQNFCPDGSTPQNLQGLERITTNGNGIEPLVNPRRIK